MIAPEPRFATPQQVAEAERRIAPAYLPFPVKLLPVPIREFVVVAAEAIGCDASYVALPLLTSLAAAIGNSRRIRLKGTWTEPAAIWVACVGESGTTKSPAQECALQFVRRRQEVALRRHEEESKESERDRLVAERDLAKWKRGKDAAPPPEVPAEPIPERFIVGDTTIEALLDLLSKQPRGLLVARDELGGWLGSFGRYTRAGASESAMWLEMHGGRPITIDRKTSRPVHVPRALVSIAGCITPGALPPGALGGRALGGRAGGATPHGRATSSREAMDRGRPATDRSPRC